VFARLVYFHALRLEKEGKIDMEELEIEDDLINDLHIHISPIHNERIRAEFVKNLHNITLDEFELNLKKLQRKFQNNRQYREDFIPYSTWLIKRVLTIISERKPKEQTTNFERLILENIEKNPDKILYKNTSQESWEHLLKYQIDKFMDILNLPNSIKKAALELYYEILEYNSQKGHKENFSKFYDSLGSRKDPKYIAAVLIYIILKKEGFKITQKNISDQLEIHRRIITDVLSVIRNYLIKMPKHLYIYNITRSEGLSFENLNILFQGVVNYFKKVNIDLTNEDLKEIRILLKNWNLNVNELKVKGLKYLLSAIFYIYIMFYKDQKIYQKEYVKIICDLTPFSLNYSRFSISFSELFKKYFTLDIDKYKQKTVDYLMEYVNELDATKEILETSLELFEHALNKKLKKPFTSINLTTQITELKILHIDNEGEVHYIFPQEMAIILLYYSLKQFEIFDFLASRSKFKEFLGELHSVRKSKIKFKTLIETNRVYPLLKDKLGRLKRQWFTKENFIKELTETLKDEYHSDTNLLLKLYILSIKSNPDLSPQIFIQLLGIYGGKLGIVYRDIVVNRKAMIHPKVFENISSYIETNIPEVEKNDAREFLTNFIKKRREEWNNYDKKYKFQWNEPNTFSIKNNDLSKLLRSYLTSISLGQFPLSLFLDVSTDRASSLKLIAKKPHQIKTQNIYNFFHQGNKLVYKFPHNMEATKLLNLVKKIYTKSTFISSKAHRILQDDMIKLDYGRIGKINPIATEIPVWKKYYKFNEFITGHIDFLFVIDDYLIIADLKPHGKSEILKSIPQLLAYAFMLKERLRELNEDKTLSFRILCLGFSKDEAWIFNPDDVKKEILYFMMKEGVKSPIIDSTEKLIAFLVGMGN